MVFDSTIADNAARPGEGGGISSSGTLIVAHSRITDNVAEDVGGISAGGFIVVEHSSIVANDADGAGLGGIRNGGTMYITASTIAGNRGQRGGGIQNFFSESTLIIDNSTIAENLSQVGPGGIQNEGTLTIINSTITRNTTFRPSSLLKPSAGIGNIPFLTPGASVGTVILQNTILAQNTFDEPPPSGSGGPDCSGPITSFGHNLIGDPTDCDITLQASDRTGDPGLGPFTDNGRPGNGHFPLLPTSQAIDAGNDAVCPRRDQLGQRRVDIPGVGTSRCDIGAIEFQHRDKHQDDADNDQPDADPASTAQVTP
jgi:hypothetical protein